MFETALSGATKALRQAERRIGSFPVDSPLRRRINEGSPEYIGERAKANRGQPEVFGKSELVAYYAKQESGSKGYFYYLRADIKNILSKDQYRETKAYFVDEIFRNGESCEAIKKQLTATNLTEEEIVAALLNDQLDDRTFALIIDNHVKTFESKRQEFEIFADKVKDEFRTAALAACRSGYLPISEDKLSERIAEPRIYLNDPLKYSSILGDYKLWKVNISDITPQAFMRMTIFHELTHAISGKALMLHEVGVFKHIEATKRGLLFQKPRKADMGEMPHELILQWLNEAMTDTIANCLSGEGVTYIYELAGLMYLTDKGIPETLFRDAYFEDYDITASPQQRLPATRRLFREINALIGPGALNKISKQAPDKPF